MRMLFAAIFLFLTLSAYTQKKLTIVVDNIQVLSGNLEVGIYNDAKSFPKKGKEYEKLRIKVTSPKMIFSTMLPAGTYAVAIYHDVNSNEKCDRNLLKIPTEAYGFSNNIKPRFSAPDFKVTKFELTEDKVISIHLIQ